MCIRDRISSGPASSVRMLTTSDAATSAYSVGIAVVPLCDHDGDGIANNCDLDSDDDGCPDALDGGGSFTSSDIDANDMLTGGVDANGIPTSATSSGQTLGDSQDDTVDTGCAAVCVTTGPDKDNDGVPDAVDVCLLYTSPSPRDATLSRMPSSA